MRVMQGGTRMELQTGLSGPRSRGKKPARQDEPRREARAKSEPKPVWDENSPSYLDAVEASLAMLTQEEQEALHLSLQE